MDVLPSAYSFFNSDWLSNDWYLSLNVPYRQFLGYIIGFFVQISDFIPVMLLGRLLTYVLFAFAYYYLLEVTKVKFLFGSVALMIYLYWFADGAFYGEWMVGGLDTKVFSYVFVLLSISTFLKNRIRSSLLFAGFALSFHIMIGGYFVICLCLASLLKLKRQLYFWKDWVRNFHFYLIGGIWGLLGIYRHIIDDTNSDLAQSGWDIYTQIRVPYHVMPKFSFLSLFIPFFFTVFSFIVIRFSKKENLKLLSSFVLTAYAISLVGYFIYFTGETQILRFYFFRLNDALQPFLCLIIGSSIISDKLNYIKEFLTYRLEAGVFFILLVGFGFVNFQNVRLLFNPANYTEEAILKRSAIDLNMTRWIRANTTEKSIFIVPINMPNFYLEAERALFVSWKHSPQSAYEMEEWYKRMMLINKGMDFKEENSFYPEDVEENYTNLTENDLSKIRNDYPEVSHVLLPKETFLQFPVIYQTDEFKLYELE